MERISRPPQINRMDRSEQRLHIDIPHCMIAQLQHQQKAQPCACLESVYGKVFERVKESEVLFGCTGLRGCAFVHYVEGGVCEVVVSEVGGCGV